MTARRALVIEDDPDLQNLLREVLSNAGFEVLTAASGVAGLEAARSFAPDVITLDLNLPDTDGLILCRGLRKASDAYILILTARHDESQILIGLDSGADDYMRKPFSSLELSARISALLRRPRTVVPVEVGTAAPVLVLGGLAIDTGRRTAALDGTDLGLTKIEFDVLAALAARPEQLLTRHQLLQQVWGVAWGDPHLVDVHVANVRAKVRSVGAGGVEILTVRGLGFRLHDRDGASGGRVTPAARNRAPGGPS